MNELSRLQIAVALLVGCVVAPLMYFYVIPDPWLGIAVGIGAGFGAAAGFVESMKEDEEEEDE